MRYIPQTNVPTKSKYEVFHNGELVLTTLDAFTAKCEYQMRTGKVEIKVTEVQK